MISRKVTSFSKIFLKSTMRNIGRHNAQKYSKMATFSSNGAKKVMRNIEGQNSQKYLKMTIQTVNGAKKVMAEKLNNYIRVWDDIACRLTLLADRPLNPSICLSTYGCESVNSSACYYSMQQQADDILAADKSRPQDDVRAEESVPAASEGEAKATLSDWDEDDTPVVDAMVPEGSVGSICSNLARESQVGSSVDDALPGSESANYMTFNPFSPHVQELSDAVTGQDVEGK